MIDRGKHCRIASLNRPQITKRVRIECVEHGDDITQRGIQLVEQRVHIFTAQRCKLLVTMANIGCTTNPTHDPLAHIAREMEQQVGDAV